MFSIKIDRKFISWLVEVNQCSCDNYLTSHYLHLIKRISLMLYTPYQAEKSTHGRTYSDSEGDDDEDEPRSARYSAPPAPAAPAGGAGPSMGMFGKFFGGKGGKAKKKMVCNKGRTNACVLVL